MTSEPQATNPLAPVAAFAVCSAIWSSTFLVISIGNDTMPPLWAATLRLVIASVVLVALVRITGNRLPRGPALRAAAAYGFLNTGLSFCALYWAEKSAPSGLAAVVYATVPLTTALFARVAGLERLRGLKVGGSLVALLGVGVIFSDQLRARVGPLPLLSLVAAATLGSVSGVVLKRGPHQSALGANAVAAMVGLVVCAFASFAAREPHVLPTGAKAIVPIVYLALMGSVVAYGLYVWLVHHWPLTRVSFIAVVVPVLAVLLGALVRHERLNAAALSGSLLVLAGLGLGILSDYRRAAPAPAPALAAPREA